MRFKLFYIVILFQIAAFHSWGQNINDILQRGVHRPKSEETTLILDTDIGREKTPEEQERAKQDSIKHINEAWKKILSEKNNEIQQLSDSIQQLNPYKTSIDEMKEYIRQVNSLKRRVEDKIQNDGLWKNNGALDDMHSSFLDAYDKALLKLESLIEKKKQRSTDKLIALGIGLAAIIVGIPLLIQQKARWTMNKIKKLQIKQVKKQTDEEERQRLLAGDDTFVI